MHRAGCQKTKRASPGVGLARGEFSKRGRRYRRYIEQLPATIENAVTAMLG
jgi:hypothetical protein